MEKLLTALTYLWCQSRRMIISFNNLEPETYRGWYQYDVVNLKEVYANKGLYDVQNKKLFGYKKSYQSNNYELVREVKIFNYLITISYYKEEGFHKDLGLEKPITCDNVVNLSDYKSDKIYSYDLLVSLTSDNNIEEGGEAK